ncbi:MAG TPA: 2-methylcitrate dehydratase [Rhizobiales bacterium]|nr:2-methylcitrate dehydratase [Hyphomicrobiales bacterium]
MTLEFATSQTLEEFAAVCGSHPRVKNQQALDVAQSAFKDTIACIFAASTDPVTNAVRRTLNENSIGKGSAIGSMKSFSAENAAMINGTAAHALDFDDNFLPAITHASAVLVPTLLALGEERESVGGDLLDAYIIGLEAQAWLGDQMSPSHYIAGWHATSTIGAVGAAAASARLLSLNTVQVRNALSIACSLAGGSKIQFGTMVKPLHAGLAAQSGIIAARLAASGVEAHPNPIAGEWGFANLHHGQLIRSRSSRDHYTIIVDGLAQKRFPCCASAHRSLDAIIAIRRSNNIDPEDIASIETIVPTSNFRNLRFDYPRDEKEARFSMTYCSAVAALFGKASLADFQPDSINRPSVQAMMAKVTMRDAGTKSDRGIGIWDFPAETRITLKDGSVLSKSIQQPVGTRGKPLTEQDHQNKFVDCVANKISKNDFNELATTLSNFQKITTNQLMVFFQGAGRL